MPPPRRILPAADGNKRDRGDPTRKSGSAPPDPAASRSAFFSFWGGDERNRAKSTLGHTRKRECVGRTQWPIYSSRVRRANRFPGRDHGDPPHQATNPRPALGVTSCEDTQCIQWHYSKPMVSPPEPSYRKEPRNNRSTRVAGLRSKVSEVRCTIRRAPWAARKDSLRQPYCPAEPFEAISRG